MIAFGLDIGTTTISAAAFDTEQHILLAAANVPTDADATAPAQRAHGWAEIDMQRVHIHALVALQRVATQLGNRVGEVNAIGMTGQMHGMAFLDHGFTPARTAITWQDQRGREVLPAFMARAGGAGAFAKMGALPAAGYAAVTLFWLREHGALPNAQHCTIPDAVGAMLCQATPKIDATHAAGWGVIDIERGVWDDDILKRLGLHMPPLAASGTTIGHLAHTAAQVCGLRDGIPVTVALGDHQASLIGSGCTRAGTAHVNIGTGGQVSLITSRFAAMDPAAGIETRPFINGLFVLTGAALCGGSAFALLRRFYEDVTGMMGLPVTDEATLYAQMLAGASGIHAGADGLTADTRFDGARHDPDIRASLQGLSRGNFTPAHLNRAVLEGIAGELAQFYEGMSQTQGRASALFGAGNGLRKNPLLQEIVRRRFGLPLQLPVWQEEAAIGAAQIVALK